MGLLSKKGKALKFSFALHVHTLTLNSCSSSLCVTFERGSHAGSTRAVQGLRGSYAFEQLLELPATLYQDAGGSRNGRGASGSFQAKELRLAVVPADKRGRPAGAPLATATLNLADFAGEAAPVTQTLTLSPGGRLLLTIGCHEAGKGGEGALALQRSMSGLEAAAREGLPASLSTDEEGGSRPSSAGAYSRPGSAAEGTVAGAYERQLSAAALGAIPEEAGAAPAPRSRSPQRQQHAGAMPAAAAAAAAQQEQPAAAAPPPAAPEGSAKFDEDGFLLDESLDVEASQGASTSVRRDLGSALERAEASEGSCAPPEVESRLGGGGAAGAAAGAAAGPGAFARARCAPVPATPAGVLAAEAAAAEPLSTGQESTFSAAGDPAVPFSVPPSTSRRFAQREGAGGRRWAWRREGGGAAAGAAPSAFQRARLASASKHEGEGVPAPEQSGHSVASSGGPASSAELSLRPLSSPDEAAGQHSAVASPSAASATAAAGLSAFQPGGQLFGGAADAPALAAAAAAAQRQRGASAGGGLPGGPLRPTLSLVPGDSAALPSPVDGAPYGAASAQLVEALLQELRSLAALESAVYLAGGRRAFAGGGRELHTPARRLARTIISLEAPHQGLGFGLQAVRAIRATCGAASGDLHRLAFWWSNVLQLRWSFWELCRGQGLEAGAGAPPRRSGSRQEGLEAQGSGAVSPRAALASAASARSAAASGLEWMLVLLPQLRDLEGWLFGQMLRHLWWRVLLQGVTQQPGGDAAGGNGGSGNGSARSARPAAPLAKATSATSDQFSPSTQQGTPRSFETPEEEAVHRWVQGLRAVERALKDSRRPAPAPRAHLALLHRQLITALLRRLDTLLFRKLLAEEGDSPRHLLRLPSMSGRDVFARSAAAGAETEEALGMMGADAAAVVALEQGVLPFQRGALTFGTGVSLKMAVSRLTQWAADCGVKEEKLPQAGRSTDMPDYRLFPHLRATADLLMMPKEVLTDRQMRREVVPGLPLRRICQLLERWEPDESAPDPLPPGLMEALQSESPHSEGSTPSPTSRQAEEYLAPDEEALLAEGVIEPLSLELGEESEDELEALAAGTGEGLDGGPEPSPGGTAAPGDEARASRFALLRALWAPAAR